MFLMFVLLVFVDVFVDFLLLDFELVLLCIVVVFDVMCVGCVVVL